MRIFIANFNGVLDDLVKRVEKDLTHTWIDADVVILWQDVMGGLDDIALQARGQGKKVYVVEHGLLSINDYLPPLSRPLTAEKMLTWGQWSKDWLVNNAHLDPVRVEVVGTLLRNKMVKKVKGEKRVLFAPRHWAGELKENIQIAEVLKNLPYTVRSKIVVGEHNPSNYPNPIGSDRQGPSHVDTCFNQIARSDVVVGLGEGTFAALCYMMDVPYISVDIWEPKVLLGKLYTKQTWDSQLSDACYKVPLDELADAVDRVLTKDTKAKDRKHFREYALNWNEDPMDNFIKLIYG